MKEQDAILEQISKECGKCNTISSQTMLMVKKSQGKIDKLKRKEFEDAANIEHMQSKWRKDMNEIQTRIIHMETFIDKHVPQQTQRMIDESFTQLMSKNEQIKQLIAST